MEGCTTPMTQQRPQVLWQILHHHRLVDLHNDEQRIAFWQ